MLDVATILAEKHQVVIATDTAYSADEIKNLRLKYQTFFNLNLENIEFLNSPLKSGSAWKKLQWTKNFDCLYYLTDGSLFFSAARNNILHIQIPFTHSMNSPLQRAKLHNWQLKNTNSLFTKKVIESHWPTKINEVHQPLVVMPWSEDEVSTHLEKKAKVILNVGRFFRQLHSKRQDVLVEVFKSMCQELPAQTRGWKLVLVGVIEDQSYADEIHQAAKGFNIEFYHNLNRSELLAWYEKASLYWHAAGFEIDESQHPEKVEHFGISTIEAMSYGAVPIVVGKGGQKEILTPDLNSNLWQTVSDCLEITKPYLTHKSFRHEVQRVAINRARDFDKQHFSQVLWRMINH